MIQFRLKHPVGIQLDFASSVTLRGLERALQPVKPQVVQEFPMGGWVEEWTVAVRDSYNLTLLSPLLPPEEGSLDGIIQTVGILNQNLGSSSATTARQTYRLVIGMKDLTLQEIWDWVKAAWQVEPAIKTLLSPNRYQHLKNILLRKVFTRPPDDPGSREILLGSPMVINLKPLLTQGTVEVNYFGGTSNPFKVVFWILLWCSILDRSLLEGPPSGTVDTFEGLAEWLRWPAREEASGENPLWSAREFFCQRAQEFQGRGSPGD